MKISFALGLISLTIAGVSANAPAKVPVSLNTNTMGAVIKAAGSAAVDPTLTCAADYTLALTCKLPTTTPFSLPQICHMRGITWAHLYIKRRHNYGSLRGVRYGYLY
jgi:hypothetical protein